MTDTVVLTTICCVNTSPSKDCHFTSLHSSSVRLPYYCFCFDRPCPPSRRRFAQQSSPLKTSQRLIQYDCCKPLHAPLQPCLALSLNWQVCAQCDARFCCAMLRHAKSAAGGNSLHLRSATLTGTLCVRLFLSPRLPPPPSLYPSTPLCLFVNY